MSWSVSVKAPKGFLEVDEKISSICQSPGSLVCCIEMLGFQNLSCLNKKGMIQALTALIEEIDKGDGGIFSNEKCVDFDEKWSQGRETRAAYEEWIPLMGKVKESQRGNIFGFTDYESFCGWAWRKRTREDALRFYLYLKAGYDIQFEW